MEVNENKQGTFTWYGKYDCVGLRVFQDDPIGHTPGFLQWRRKTLQGGKSDRWLWPMARGMIEGVTIVPPVMKNHIAFNHS